MKQRHNSKQASSFSGLRLLASLLLLGATAGVQAQDCSDYTNGLLDGFAGTVAPSQLQVDRNCTVRNYPSANPLSTNFSFLTQPGQTDDRWLIVFDNVEHTGQMACNSVANHKIWFTNGSSTTIQEGCQNLLIPVEKIDKQNPPGPGTIPVGVPFTYRLTLPVLFDAGTGTVINNSGSLNDLHSMVLWDDLNATGADLSYVSHVVYWADDGSPVPHTFSNNAGLLRFADFPIIPAGRQAIIELTVILDNSPANSIGTQFVNTAKWEFGRLIDGEFYEPLPGEWGITEPLTIAAPELEMTKTGPATLNLGESGSFVLDVRNVGSMAAWDATLVDQLPDGPDGGLCDAPPTIVSAQVFAADGVTPVQGKGPLVEGVDYSLSFASAPASCRLQLEMLSADAAIGPAERLMVTYQTEIDRDTENGITLTNVAGATEWASAAAGSPSRLTFTRQLTDGTVGIADHEDAHTVTVALTGLFFEKSVANLTSGISPSPTAAPGDSLRYTLVVRTTDTPLIDGRIRDDLGALNAPGAIVPGSLQLVPGTIPPGVDTSGTNPNGGMNGAGLIDIRNLDLPADSELAIQFDVLLAPRLANGLVVANQAELFDTAKLADSDDPYINGRADPVVDDDEDETRVTIVSAPEFRIEKVSRYLSGDPTVLLAGERLGYVITVQNIGNDNAAGVSLVDQIPANTTYVPGSTFLNGLPVPDDAAGASPLVSGILINAPEDPTPGAMNADVADNVATIVFEVLVDPDVADGVILSNQAFVSAVGTMVADQPSDDPRTPVLDDPTRDVVGQLPLLFATKEAALQIDAGSPGIVDPGDVLRYTVTVYNSGTVPATVVELFDEVPANTTYVADSTLLNGSAVGVPDGGVFPLASRLSISSADQPLSGPGEGIVSPGESAVVQFDLRIDDSVPRRTLITNQAVVYSDELQNLLTDGDGNPATGPEPTIVVVGDAQVLTIAKTAAVVGGGPVLAGATLEYTVTIRNISTVPAYYVEITDDLSVPNAGYLTYVDQSARMNGLPDGVGINGTVLTADYSAVNGSLPPGETVVLRFRAVIADTLADGTLVTNVARVAWNDPLEWAEASVTVAIGAIPGVGILSGSVWHDADFDDSLDVGERSLDGWSVTLLQGDQSVITVFTDSAGRYSISGVTPNYATGAPYALEFQAPGAGASTAAMGQSNSEFSDGLQRIDDIVVESGSVFRDLNLPIDPNGVIYDSLTRRPLDGVRLTLLDAASGSPLPAACFYDPAQQNQVTLASGYYKFDMSFSDPACPSAGSYAIQVTPSGGSNLIGVSELIPPSSDRSTAPFDVPLCPGSSSDAILATSGFCEVQVSEFAPGAAVVAGSAGTAYHLHLTLDDSLVPGSAQLFNNHIPVDQDLSGAVTVTKTTPMFNVTRGQMVPYEITITSTYGIDLSGIAVVDRPPAGFRYIEGSARFDDEPLEPELVGRDLYWQGLALAASGRHTIRLLLAAGSGVSEGEFTNRAQALDAGTATALSAEATATVRVVPDPDFDCTDVTGKVFDDANRNGYQDEGEEGLAGIRLVTARGLAANTDRYGRYHITCAITPQSARGSNFVIKLDDRTLPTGFRASTRPVQIQRATRGKALRINFGASIHRVIGMDLADAAFVPDEVALRPQWRHRIDRLLEELEKAPATLRLSYVADIEDESLVERRLDAFKTEVMSRWRERDCCYDLEIEPEIFWRRGGPPEFE